MILGHFTSYWSAYVEMMQKALTFELPKLCEKILKTFSISTLFKQFLHQNRHFCLLSPNVSLIAVGRFFLNTNFLSSAESPHPSIDFNCILAQRYFFFFQTRSKEFLSCDLLSVVLFCLPALISVLSESETLVSGYHGHWQALLTFILSVIVNQNVNNSFQFRRLQMWISDYYWALWEKANECYRLGNIPSCLK